jgi:hypothetical protein
MPGDSGAGGGLSDPGSGDQMRGGDWGIGVGNGISELIDGLVPADDVSRLALRALPSADNRRDAAGNRVL